MPMTVQSPEPDSRSPADRLVPAAATAGDALPAALRLTPDDEIRRVRLASMKRIATAMLVVVAIVFIVTRLFESRYPWLAWIRAFAEAAMVGGIADWFAVTALFRHPMGLPIPHTAIIPRNKDRIGDTLAAFLRDNFLTPKVVARRMRSVDVAGAVGRFLAQPPAEGRIREGGSRLVADLL